MSTLTLYPGRFPIMLDKINFSSNFISTDSEEQFKHNYNKIHSYYQKADIKYVNNECGFRAKPFEQYTKGFGLALGCSHTYGVGVRQEDTWHAELGRCIGKQFVNLGCESHGIEAVCSVAREWTKHYARPDCVFIQLPDFNRKTHAILRTGHTDRQGVSHDEWYTELETRQVTVHEDDLTQEYAYATTINYTVEHFANQNIPVRLWSYQDDHAVNRFVKYNIQDVVLTDADVNNFLARDLAHQGHITQFRVAGELQTALNDNMITVSPKSEPMELTEENQKELTIMLRTNNRIIYN